MQISTLILVLTPSVLLADGTCQTALQSLGTGWVAFNVTIHLPGQNATFISGTTRINSTTTHQQHFADRTDGQSDTVQISINSTTSKIMVFNQTWKDRRTFDLTCTGPGAALRTITGNGVNLVLARSTSPWVELNLDAKEDAVDQRPGKRYSSDELAAMALATIRVLTQSEPAWVTRMRANEQKFGLSGEALLAYRMLALNVLTGVR